MVTGQLRCIVLSTTMLVASVDMAAANATRPAAREALVQRATQALARGDAGSALRDFEAAATQEHAADIEVGIVHSLMLAGQYRRALAFAAHTALAHPDAPEGAAVYARLLEVGGQAVLAARVRPPGITASRESHARATGVAIDGGRHVLLPTASLGETSIVRLHDGHGRALTAHLVRRNETLGLALMRLDEPLPALAPLTWAARDPFVGSLAHVIAATPTPADTPPWPRLHSGFVGAHALGIDLTGDAHGGAVFDRAGRAIGIAVRDHHGADRLVGVASLRSWLGALLDAQTAAPAGTPQMPSDAIYENALRVTLRFAGPAL